MNLDILSEVFGQKTMEKGKKYYEEGRVKAVIKANDVLIGAVQGRFEFPYIVEVNLNNLKENHCTCPLGGSCKHVVAVILYYHNEKNNVIELNEFVTLLKSAPHKHLYEVMNYIATENPIIIKQIYDRMKLVTKALEDINEFYNYLKKEINRIFRNADLSYYGALSLAQSINVIFRKIRDFSKINRRKAIKLLLELLNEILQCYMHGVDDSSGVLGARAYEIVEYTCKLLKEEENIDEFIDDVVNLIVNEDYGLEYSTLLSGITRKHNYNMILNLFKKKLLEKYDTNRCLIRLSYIAETISQELNIKVNLCSLVRNLIHKINDDYILDALEILVKCKDKNLVSYLTHRFISTRLQNPPLNFNKIAKVLKVASEVIAIDDNTYWRIMSKLKGETYITRETYENLKKAFKRDILSDLESIGARPELLFCISIYEKKIDIACKYAIKSIYIEEDLLREFIKLALRNHQFKKKALDIALIYVTGVPPKYANLLSLKEVRTYVLGKVKSAELDIILRYVNTSLLFKILQDSPDKHVIIRHVKQRIREFQFDEVKSFVQEIFKYDPKSAVKLAVKWINFKASKSYHYHDQCINLLKIMRKFMNKDDWRNLVETIITMNETKKKFVSMLKKLIKTAQ